MSGAGSGAAADAGGEGRAPRSAGAGTEASGVGSTSDPTPRVGPRADRAAGPDREPCLRCGVALPVRLMGCKGGHCPNCGHPYPHGDCSD